MRLAPARIARQALSAWRALPRALRRLNGVDVAQLHVKVSAAAWAFALLVVTPAKVGASLGTGFVWVLTAFVFCGALVSSAGLIVAARNPTQDPVALRRDLRRSLRGLGIELIGLVFMIAGIVLYFLTQLVLTFGPEGDQRVALTVFAYFAGATLLARVAAVQHRRRKEALLARAIGGTT